MHKDTTPNTGGRTSLSRRNLLAFAAAGSAATLPAVAFAEASEKTSRLPQPSELPVERVNRLASELSHALNDYSYGECHAEIYPSRQREFAIAIKFPMPELSLDTQLDICVANLKNVLAQMSPDADIYERFSRRRDGSGFEMLLIGEVSQ